MTVYQLAHAVEPYGVSQQAVYRLARVDGRPQRIDVRLLAALYDVLGLTSVAQLLHRDGTEPEMPPPWKPAVAKRHRRAKSARKRS